MDLDNCSERTFNPMLHPRTSLLEGSRLLRSLVFISDNMAVNMDACNSIIETSVIYIGQVRWLKANRVTKEMTENYLN